MIVKTSWTFVRSSLQTLVMTIMLSLARLLGAGYTGAGHGGVRSCIVDTASGDLVCVGYVGDPKTGDPVLLELSM